jgi:hypothetical protein
MLSEKMMEDAVSAEPEKYLGEKGLQLVARQYSIGSYVFDLLFEDRRGARLIVELQKGTLDRNHTYKILDYYDEYKENNPDAFIELMVIANRIPHERRRRLDSHGVSWKEIPESEFVNIPVQGSEQSENNLCEMDNEDVKNKTRAQGESMRNKTKIIPDIYDKIGIILRDMLLDHRTSKTFTTKEVYELYVQKYPEDEELLKKRKGCNLWIYLPGMVSDYSKYGSDGGRDKPAIQRLAPRTYSFI